MLNGIANVSTSNMNLIYHTGSFPYEYTWVSIAGNVNSSGLPDTKRMDTINGVAFSDSSFSPFNLNPFKLNINPFNNMGWAFDLGFTYNPTPRLKIAASAIDIGYINWKEKVYNYGVNNVLINFPGLTLPQVSDSAVKKQYTDSLSGLIKTSGTTKNSYTTILPARFIISADYDLSLRDKVGFLYQLQYYLNTFYPSYTLNYSRKIGTNWRITTNYGYYNNSFTNLGLGTSVKWGAFQIYLMQDDILFYFIPSVTRTVYVRFGFNLVWGENKPRIRF